VWTAILEISVVMAQFPSPEIAELSYKYRTLGLGYTSLGSLLMIMGLAYDSPEGRAVAGTLSAILTGEAYAQSARMAAELGPFAQYAENSSAMLRVIRNHRRACYNAPPSQYEGLHTIPQGINSAKCHAAFDLSCLLDAAKQSWDDALSLGEKHGFRNAQVSAIAPTGTIGLLMDCDTTGVEPDFALVKFKKLAGGGSFKIINQSVPPALAALGYSEAEIEAITAYATGHKTLKGCPAINAESLAQKGFTPEAIALVEEALKSAYSLEAVLNLKQLGFSSKEIEEAELYACGTLGLEGAPGLKKEHYPVFDTATPSGKHGRRSIPWTAHVEMMAACQPFISGAISKTINMPNTANYEDVKGAYMLAWKRALKSVALYRDGSKLSQPLSSYTGGAASGTDMIADTILRIKKSLAAGVSGEEKKEKKKSGGKTRGTRKPLPNRRSGYTQKSKIAGHSIFIRTGEYDDGSLGEIFLDMHKEGAAFRSLLNSFAIAVSLGLQYGVPLEEYVDAFTFSRFEPNGIVKGHDYVKMATSVIDFIFRDLAISYLKRVELGQVKPEDLLATGTKADNRAENNALWNNGEGFSQARIKGYEGDSCPSCGSFTLIRNGTCMKCDTCGETTGCS
jgi:ribonucleoside-diphosphate reductase alpha chain